MRHTKDFGEAEWDIINFAKELVRETGYHVCRLNTEGNPGDEAYSRSYSLYIMACDFLRRVAPVTGPQHIERTYKPANLQESRAPRVTGEVK